MGSGTYVSSCFIEGTAYLCMFLSHVGSRCVGLSPFGPLLLFALGIKVCHLHAAGGVRWQAAKGGLREGKTDRQGRSWEVRTPLR